MEENSTGFCFFYFIFAPAIQATALGDSMIKNSPKEQEIVVKPIHCLEIRPLAISGVHVWLYIQHLAWRTSWVCAESKSAAKFLSNAEKFYFAVVANWLHQTLFFSTEKPVWVSCLSPVNMTVLVPVCASQHPCPCEMQASAHLLIAKAKQWGKCGLSAASASQPCITSHLTCELPSLAISSWL